MYTHTVIKAFGNRSWTVRQDRTAGLTEDPLTLVRKDSLVSWGLRGGSPKKKEK